MCRSDVVTLLWCVGHRVARKAGDQASEGACQSFFLRGTTKLLFTRAVATDKTRHMVDRRIIVLQVVCTATNAVRTTIS